MTQSYPRLLSRLLKPFLATAAAILFISALFCLSDTKADAVSIKSVSVSSISAKTYTGAAIKPTVTVKYKGKKLTLNKDYTVTYKNNTNAGTATVTIKGKGNYSGSVSKNFTIKPLSVNSVSAQQISARYYTGKAIKPALTLKFKNKSLTLNKDYTVSYSANTNPGTAKVTIKGKGNFSGSRTLKFTISKLPLSKAKISVSSQYYTGKALKPSVTVTYGSATYKLNTHYTVTYKNNTNVGTATVTVKGKGGLSGSRSVTFSIKKLPLSKAKISVSSQYYTGKALKPSVTVTYGSTAYKLNTHYTVTYKNNTNVGTATVTVKGKGGLSGSKSVTFSIKNLPVSKAKISVAAQTYSGKALKPSVTVTYGSTTYKLNTHYTVTYKNNTNAGTATVTVKGKSGITGSKSVTFKINPKSLSGADVAVPPATFTGTAQKPAPTVTLNNKTLKSSDYTVSYSDNVSTGKASLKITGRGNYTGTLNASFNILSRPISQANLSGSAQYSPKGVTGEIKGNILGYQLKSSELSYTLPDSAGSHNVTVTGKGNFSGQTTVELTVQPAQITAAAAEITCKDGVYGVTVRYDGYLLTKDKDYTLSITESGATVTAVMVGKGNYAGTLTVKKNITGRELTVDAIGDAVYTGSPIVPALTVRYNGTVLARGDYSAIYKNNINAGTATVEITGSGSCADLSETVSFKILPAQISLAAGSCKSVSFAGKAVTPKPALTFNGKTLVSGTDYVVSSYKNNGRIGTASLTVTGKGNFTGTKTVEFQIKQDLEISEKEERQKIKNRLTEMMNGKYGRQINSYWHSYKLGDYFNTMLDSPCTCHGFCNNGYEDGCTCLIGRSTVLGSNGEQFSGIQCAGFAFEVFDYLFAKTNGAGENTLIRYGSDRGNWTLEGIKEDFSRFRPGDYLAYTNYMYGYDHYVIVYDTDDEGVWVYEANFGGRCKINLRKMTYEEFYEQTDDIYYRTPNNYELSDM